MSAPQTTTQFANTARALRVLFLIDSFRMGGAERITASLLPHFDRSQVMPILCTLHTRRESPLADQLGDIIRVDLGAKRLLDPAAFRRLLTLIDREQIDLIHAQLQDATIFGAAAHVSKGTPLVITRHLLGDDETNRRRRLRSGLERFAIRHTAARIIAVSDAAGEHYARLINLPITRFATIYNGIELEQFAPADDTMALRIALGLPEDRPIVTFVGVLREGKGHEVAIEAARKLEGVSFLFVGDGKPAFRASLEKQAEGLEDRIYFLGQRLDVPDILRASDMLILPSDSEALPTVLIEAGAASLPAIASDVGGSREIIDDGMTGIIIPPRDANALAQGIRRLLDNPETAAAMGQRAQIRVNQLFTLPGQAAALTALYQQIVAESRTKGRQIPL